MKKFLKKALCAALAALTLAGTLSLAACGGDGLKEIRVSASQKPHAEILNEKVNDLLKAKGYKLKVTEVDWNIPNDSVAAGDDDANYFQHVPYLETYTGKVKLAAACKVHYEPLGIYRGKAADGAALADGKSFAICNDVSNGVRALELLEANGIFSKVSEGENYPVTKDGKFAFEGEKWTTKSGVEVTLVSENMLAAALPDYDYACLPCNTALTGDVTAEKRVAVESDPAQVVGKANILAVRADDYKNDAEYKAKIDALTEALLSEEVAEFVKTKYNGVIICNSVTQIDLRKDI